MKFSETKYSQWEPNVILVDADWLDRMVFDLIVNFEPLLKRRLPKVALDRWVDYLSLDGGLRPGDNKVQVLLIYSSTKKVLNNCMPASLADDLNGKAFKDNLGEFLFSSFPVEENVVTRENLFVQSAEALLNAAQVKRLMLIPDLEAYGTSLRRAIAQNEEKNTTLFTTQPVTGFHCKQEILTYSLLATLGIRSEELPK